MTVSGDPTNVTCHGASDGSIFVTHSIGASVVITDSMNVDVTANNGNFGPGDYTLTATANDGNNIGHCTNTVIVTISEPTAVSVSGLATNVTCHGAANGFIAITHSIGSTLVIIDSNSIDVTANNGSLEPGDYTLTATASDGNGIGYCTSTASITIIEPIEVTVSGIATHITCYGSADGSIDITKSIGSTVVITNSSNIDVTANNGTYGPDVYILTATAPNGNGTGYCSSADTVTIIGPPLVTVSGIPTNVSCFGSSDGSIAITHSVGATVVIKNYYCPR